MTLKQAQHGVALITALLVVSLATVLAASLVEHLYYDIRRTENIMLLDQSQLYNSNAVSFGMVMIQQDRSANNEFDSKADIQLFNDQAAIFPVEGGTISAFLTDLQSCFNVNNLSKTNPQWEKARAQYIRLLANLGIDSNLHATLADSLIDWIDIDDIYEPQGAEFDYYIGLLPNPYRTSNTLMVSISELALIKGYTAKVIDTIKTQVCALPVSNTLINVNIASAEMLDSIEGLTGYGQQIVQARDGDPQNTNDDAPFTVMDDFNSTAKRLGVKANVAGVQVFSEYFLLTTRAQLGSGDVKLFSIIYRDNSNAETRLIRQTSGAL